MSDHEVISRICAGSTAPAAGIVKPSLALVPAPQHEWSHLNAVFGPVWHGLRLQSQGEFAMELPAPGPAQQAGTLHCISCPPSDGGIRCPP
jgi:hypothetical protein